MEVKHDDNEQHRQESSNRPEATGARKHSE